MTPPLVVNKGQLRARIEALTDLNLECMPPRGPAPNVQAIRTCPRITESTVGVKQPMMCSVIFPLLHSLTAQTPCGGSSHTGPSTPPHKQVQT